MLACRFLAAGAALCAAAFYKFVAGATFFFDVAKVVFDDSQCQGCTNMTQGQQPWQGGIL